MILQIERTLPVTALKQESCKMKTEDVVQHLWRMGQTEQRSLHNAIPRFKDVQITYII